jgi:hypothetical protein
LPNTASELAKTKVGRVPSLRQAWSSALRGFQVAAHAQVEIGFALTADGCRQVEYDRCTRFGQLATRQEIVQVASLEVHPRVGCQVVRRRRSVGQRDPADRLSGAAARCQSLPGKQRARKPRAQKAAAAGDEDVHVGSFSSVSRALRCPGRS